MDIFKRSLAPIVPAAWEEIDEQAAMVLKGVLAGRKVVDVKGPLGWNTDAVSEGTLSLVEESPVEDVSYGIRESLPLVEIRVPFTMSMWDLDDISRNSKTIDFTPLIEAARKAALFEDTAVFQGLEEAGILGLEIEADNEPIEFKLEDECIVASIVEAITTLGSRSMAGPYALVCSLPLWTKIKTSAKGYPLFKRVKDILGEDGRIVLSPQYDTCMLVSMKEGNSELIIGQDFSIGYQSHTNTDVSFYITETFTFRTIAPESIVPFKIAE
ncbi:MAG: Maritimacin [Synergistaceae bacterium]